MKDEGRELSLRVSGVYPRAYNKSFKWHILKIKHKFSNRFPPIYIFTLRWWESLPSNFHVKFPRVLLDAKITLIYHIRFYYQYVFTHRSKSLSSFTALASETGSLLNLVPFDLPCQNMSLIMFHLFNTVQSCTVLHSVIWDLYQN